MRRERETRPSLPRDHRGYLPRHYALFRPAESVFTCGEASRSMAHKMSDGGGVVVLFCHLGKFSKNLMSEEEVWCGFVYWENLTKKALIIKHALPQVYRIIALLFLSNSMSYRPKVCGDSVCGTNTSRLAILIPSDNF